MGVKEELQALIVNNPDIQLQPGEICFFTAKGKYGTPHLETTTKVKPGLGLGVVVPVTKHFGFGIGKQRVKTETTTQKVWDKEPCDFYLLDERIAIKFRKQTVDIDLESITNLKVNKDALTVSCGRQDHILFMSERDVKRFINLFNLLGQAQKSGLDMSDFASDSTPASRMSQPNTSNSTVQTAPPKVVSSDYAKTIFLWCVGRKPTPVKKRDDYPSYLFYECNIQNAPKYHKVMIEQGYLQAPSIEDVLSTLKVTELKAILQENGLPTTGKKADLIQTITKNVPSGKLTKLNSEKSFVLSEQGRQYVDEHDDYIKLHSHGSYGITQAEYDAEKNATPNAPFNDICWRIFNRRVSQTREFSEHRNLYYQMYLLTKEEGKDKVALSMILRVLYIDLSGTTNYYIRSYHDRWLTKKEFAEKIESDTIVAPGLVKEIGDLDEAFSEDVLESLFGWRLPLNYCPDKLFAEIVHSIIEGTYDEEKYRRMLTAEYKKRI